MTDKTYSSQPVIKDDYTQQDPRRNVEFSHAPRSYGRWVAWIVVLLIAIDVIWNVARNPNFEWHVVAQWFTEATVMKGLGVTLGLTVISMLLGVLLLFIVPEVMTAFTIVSTVSAILVIFTWSTILASYIAYRKKRPDLHEKSHYKMPGGLPMAWISLGFLAFVLCLLALRPDTRLALCVMPAWFMWLAVAYHFSHFRSRLQPDQRTAL